MIDRAEVEEGSRIEWEPQDADTVRCGHGVGTRYGVDGLFSARFVLFPIDVTRTMKGRGFDTCNNSGCRRRRRRRPIDCKTGPRGVRGTCRPQISGPFDANPIATLFPGQWPDDLLDHDGQTMGASDLNLARSLTNSSILHRAPERICSMVFFADNQPTHLDPNSICREVETLALVEKPSLAAWFRPNGTYRYIKLWRFMHRDIINGAVSTKLSRQVQSLLHTVAASAQCDASLTRDTKRSKRHSNDTLVLHALYVLGTRRSAKNNGQRRV